MLLSFIVAFFSAGFAAAHYTFPALIYNGQTTTDWQYVRMTTNHWSNGPVTSITDSQMRCYEIDGNVASTTSVATVAAGSTVGFKAASSVSHPGYFSAYMSSASPKANSPSAATGATWFKIWEAKPTSSGSGLSYPYQGATQVTFTIPKSLPSGDYLLRIEHVALHSANAPQFYISCAQLTVTGGGNGSPSPKVSIPGHYKGNEPGLFFNPYNLPAGYQYQAPGPAVWQG